MAIYNQKIGEMKQDNLFASVNVDTLTNSVTIAAGEGELKRGTVLSLGTDGKCKVISAATGLTPYGILCDDVDATSEAVAEVYVSGVFNKNALIVKDGYTLTAADITALRNGGIYLENSMR